MPLSPGIPLGPYDVTAKIGEGGMGEVWHATDRYCQVDENRCDRPTRYCGRSPSWADMLDIRIGLMPQLDSAQWSGSLSALTSICLLKALEANTKSSCLVSDCIHGPTLVTEHTMVHNKTHDKPKSASSAP